MVPAKDTLFLKSKYRPEKAFPLVGQQNPNPKVHLMSPNPRDISSISPILTNPRGSHLKKREPPSRCLPFLQQHLPQGLHQLHTSSFGENSIRRAQKIGRSSRRTNQKPVAPDKKGRETAGVPSFFERTQEHAHLGAQLG